MTLYNNDEVRQRLTEQTMSTTEVNFSSILGKGPEDGNYWVPAEANVSIRPGWVYHEYQDSLVRSTENLMELYYSSVGRKCNLLLNVPPDRRGLLRENDIKSLLPFQELLRKEFEMNLHRYPIPALPADTRAFRGYFYLFLLPG